MAVGMLPSRLGGTLSLPKHAPDPFVWAGGGARMTPAEIARARDSAGRQIAAGSDYSPVGHWTQGLARVANGFFGGLAERRASAAERMNSGESNAVLAALIADPPQAGTGEPQPSIAAILANQYIDASVRKFAMEQHRAASKRAAPMEINGKLVDPTTFKVLGDYSTPQQLPDIVQLSQIANDPSQPEWIRKDARDRITALNDPITNIPLPGGRAYVGPRSGIAAMDARSSVAPPGGSAPPPPPGGTLRSAGGASPQGSRGFR